MLDSALQKGNVPGNNVHQSGHGEGVRRHVTNSGETRDVSVKGWERCSRTANARMRSARARSRKDLQSYKVAVLYGGIT